MRFSLTSEQSSDQNSELSSIGRYSTSPTKLIKMNPSLPYFLKIVRVGSTEPKPLDELSLRNLLQESKLNFKEFNCCKCCSCRTENLVLSLPRKASKSRKISVETTHSNAGAAAAANRRKSSISLANVSGIIQHAVQKNVNTLEKTLHYHPAHHNATATSSLNTIGGFQPSSNAGSGNSTIKGHSAEQPNNRANDLNKGLSKLNVCCVSNAFNKRNCCGMRYAANRYHCHCPLKEILIKRNLMRKLTKSLKNEKFNFTNDLDLNKFEEFIKSNELGDDEKSERNLDSIKNYLYLHFRQHRHITNPFDNCHDKSSNSKFEGQKLNLHKNSSLNRLLDTSDDSSDTEDETSINDDDEERKDLSKNYVKINSDKSTNESGDEETNSNDRLDEDSTNKKGEKTSLNESSVKRKKKRKKMRQEKFKDQAPLLIIDEQKKHARRRRKQKKIFNEETKRCSSVSGEQDSDGQKKLFDYENNYRICKNLSDRVHLDTSEDTELSDSSITFDSEQELTNNENVTSKDELSDESLGRQESRKIKKDTDLIELKKKERKLFKKQLTDTSIRTPIENQLNEEKQRILNTKSTKAKKTTASKIKDQIKYDTNNYASYDSFYNREVLYVLPPLFLAVVNGNVSVVKELIKFGANVNSTDANGCTVLHLLLCQQRINQSLLNLLLGNGAKLSVTNLAGVAPIDLALEKASQLVGLQRKMIMTAFSALVNGLEALCTFNELNNKQTMRNQSSTTGPNQHLINTLNQNLNTTATTSTNSTIITDTISHSHGKDQSRDNQQLKENEFSHTQGSSQTGLTSGIFHSSQSSSNVAGDGTIATNQIVSSQTQDHSSSTLISVQQQFMPEHGEEGIISITQPFHSTSGTDQQSSAAQDKTGRSTNQQQVKSQFTQLNPQLNQSATNLHPNSELIKKMGQKSQEEVSGFNFSNVAALKAASGFLRKLKSSSKSSKQKKQQQLLQAQQTLLQQQQQESLQQQTDVYLCLEEISSDASHGSR